MKLQIKTLNQKSLVVDIEETKTVYDLKKELSLYPDIGVKPELQKIVYSGKILENEEKLSTYNINVKKFLVIMTIKQPLEEPATVTEAKEAEKESPKAADATTPISAPAPEFKTPTAKNSEDQKKETLVAQIVDMGYPDSDVRRALAASFYNPERAIQYLIEGIPTSPSTPEGDSNFSNTDADIEPSALDIFQNDPMFQGLRNAIQQNPSVLDQALQRVGQTNPGLLDLINEHQEEFLSMLINGSDDDMEDDGD